MKISVKIAVLFFVAAVIALVLFMLREVSKPESQIIAAERDRLASSLDKDRAQKDQAYARDLHDKLQFLGYRLAMAYRAENQPDQAVKVLETMITDEEAAYPAGRPRRSRSYFDEARYYEALMGAYQQKKDDAGAMRAARTHDELQSRARELKRQEELGEGKSVGLNAQ